MAEHYTVFCKAPGDKRGEYSEEVDVTVIRRSNTLALRQAQKVLDEFYVPGMRAVRAVWRGPGIVRFTIND